MHHSPLGWFHPRSAGNALRALLLGFALLLGGCKAQDARVRPQPADLTPRIAVLSAFGEELAYIRGQVESPQTVVIHGQNFTTGRLAGHAVVLALSGVSMVNAALTAQTVIDQFTVSALLFSGIAGGVNPDLRVGDVVVPAQWGEYQEQVFARANGSGWDTGLHGRPFGNYAMMFPQNVSVFRFDRAADSPEERFWFAADPALLAAARAAAPGVRLERCALAAICLNGEPRVVLGGNGVSGPTFVDNAEYRAWVWQTFQADALDMESAAAAHAAYTNGVPFLAFRSLSDLAGGDAGANQLLVFYRLAAAQAARVLIATIGQIP